MEEKKKEENVIYIYSGYIATGGNVNDEPVENVQYPNAVCSSPFYFEMGSVLSVTYSNAPSRAGRMYNVDGSYRTTFYNWEAQRFSIDCHLRLLANQGAGISVVKVTKADGTEINYKIIDRR